MILVMNHYVKINSGFYFFTLNLKKKILFSENSLLILYLKVKKNNY